LSFFVDENFFTNHKKYNNIILSLIAFGNFNIYFFQKGCNRQTLFYEGLIASAQKSKNLKIKQKRGDAYLRASYTKLNVNVVTTIITIVIFSVFNYTGSNIYNTYKNSRENARTDSISAQMVEEDNIETKDLKAKPSSNQKEQKQSQILWQVEIPKINLTASISEGTTKDVMDKYVGHFNNTSSWDGNIGLAAHNRRIPSKLF